MVALVTPFGMTMVAAIGHGRYPHRMLGIVAGLPLRLGRRM